jgi:O-antigen/teichoic acid export membrane protein
MSTPVVSAPVVSASVASAPVIGAQGTATRKATQDTLLGAVSGLLATGGAAITSIIVARLLGVRESGDVAYLVWLALFIATVLDGGMSSAAVRFLPELRGREEAEAARHAAGAMLRWMLLLILLAAAGAGGLVFFAPALVETPALWILVVVCAVLQALSVFVTFCLRGNRDFALAARLTSVSTLVQLAAVSAGAAMYGVTGAVGGYAIGYLILSAATLRCLDPRTAIAPDLRARVLRYAAYAWVGNVANAFVWSRAELLFLERSHGAEAVGLFAAALALTGLATRLPLMLTLGVLPMLAEHKGREDMQGLRDAAVTGTRLLALLLFPCCLGVAAVMPVLLPALYGAAFAQAVPAAIILSLAAVVSLGATVFMNVIWAVERSDVFFLLALGGAVLALVAGLTVIPGYGVIGAAVTRAMSQTVFVAAVGWFVVVRLRCKLPFAALGRILAASAIAAVVAWGILVFKPDPLGLLPAILAAAVAYVLALRLLRAAPPEDVALLGSVAQMLPARFKKPAAGLVRFVGGPADRRVPCAE